MYDDLIKQLRETPSRSKRELLDKAADAIEELLEEDSYDLGYLDCQNNKWISVKDRLPEPFVSVLGYCPDEDPLPTVHEVYMNGFGQWTSAQVYGMGNVTHWMAIPDAPKEG